MDNVVTLPATNLPMPVFGLGTWLAQPRELEAAIDAALNAGYRHFDTAFNYNNEDILGNIFKKYFLDGRLRRSEVFITTKLPNYGNRKKDVEKFLKFSLQKLCMDYVDLYLIHFPFGFFCDYEKYVIKINDQGEADMDLSTNHAELWQAMEEMMEKGLTKNIGLSNFNEHQIEDIFKTAKIKPQVLQVELHAYFQQEKLRKFCDEKNIIVTAYSPLGSLALKDFLRDKYNFYLPNAYNILEDPTIIRIAMNRMKTPSQIVLRFIFQLNVTLIPKSTNPEHIEENSKIFDFELNEEEMDEIKKLDMRNEGRVFTFLFWKGSDKHLQYPF